MLVCAQVGDFIYDYDSDLTQVCVRWSLSLIIMIVILRSCQVAAKIELQQGKAVWVPSGGAAVW